MKMLYGCSFKKIHFLTRIDTNSGSGKYSISILFIPITLASFKSKIGNVFVHLFTFSNGVNRVCQGLPLVPPIFGRSVANQAL